MVHYLCLEDVTGMALGTEWDALGKRIDFAFWLYIAKEVGRRLQILFANVSI
jgi:hypothetical protein